MCLPSLSFKSSNIKFSTKLVENDTLDVNKFILQVLVFNHCMIP